MRIMLSAIGMAFAAPAAAQAPAEAPVIAEARAFMADYARDLIAGNRRGVAERYHPDGALIQGNGTSRMESAASTTAYYLSDQWQPLAGFEWRDLHYEALSPDAVQVAGIFLYEREGRPRIVSYTGLLVRHGGRLRIRIEHESAAPVRP